jgi:hypothetical protein
MMESVKGNLLAAVQHILLPLCRIAIRNGLRIADLEGALGRAMAKAGKAELKERGRADPTQKDLELMCGMTATQARAATGETQPDSAVTNVSWAAAEVLAAWNSDRNFAGPYGLILDIAFEHSASGVQGLSFERLVRTYAGPDASPRVILEELLRTQNVEVVGDGILRCINRTYIPERLSPENIQRFAQVVHNLIGTMAVNLKRTVPGTGLFERKVFADFGITGTDFAKFNAYVRLRGQDFLDDMDQWFSAHSNAERRGDVKTGVGLYHYVEIDEDLEEYLNQLRTKGDEGEK